MEAFGRIAEIFVTAILLFLVPLNYTAAKQDMINQTYVMTETFYLVDSVRNLGYLSANMYETYLKKLKATGHVYQVDMTQYRKEAVVRENGEDYQYHYFGIYTEEIKAVLYSEKPEPAEYRFGQGDHFLLKVYNLDQSFFSRMSELLTGRTSGGPQISVIYGGAIRDEAY